MPLEIREAPLWIQSHRFGRVVDVKNIIDAYKKVYFVSMIESIIYILKYTFVVAYMHIQYSVHLG